MDLPFQWRAARRARRGAVFVESVMVISVLTIGLMGLVFFRRLYVNQLGVQRLARAAALAHAISGCEENETEAWVARDLGNFDAVAPTQQTQTANGTEPGLGNTSAETGSLLDQNGLTTQNGEGIINHITIADLSGDVSVSTTDSTGKQTRFQANVRGISYVSCGDTVEKRQYPSIIDMLQSQIRSLTRE